MPGLRSRVVVLGDPLERTASAFDGFHPGRDVVWMCEALEESIAVVSASQRIAVFVSATRRVAQALQDEGVQLPYREMHDGSLAQALRSRAAAVRRAGWDAG